jgi:hypothetical protein
MKEETLKAKLAKTELVKKYDDYINKPVIEKKNI